MAGPPRAVFDPTGQSPNDRRPRSLCAFDYGLDDYWDPVADPTSGSKKKLKWWTVNLSKFLCPMKGCSFPNDATH